MLRRKWSQSIGEHASHERIRMSSTQTLSRNETGGRLQSLSRHLLAAGVRCWWCLDWPHFLASLSANGCAQHDLKPSGWWAGTCIALFPANGCATRRPKLVKVRLCESHDACYRTSTTTSALLGFWSWTPASIMPCAHDASAATCTGCARANAGKATAIITMGVFFQSNECIAIVFMFLLQALHAATFDSLFQLLFPFHVSNVTWLHLEEVLLRAQDPFSPVQRLARKRKFVSQLLEFARAAVAILAQKNHSLTHTHLAAEIRSPTSSHIATSENQLAPLQPARHSLSL